MKRIFIKTDPTVEYRPEGSMVIVPAPGKSIELALALCLLEKNLVEGIAITKRQKKLTITRDPSIPFYPGGKVIKKGSELTFRLSNNDVSYWARLALEAFHSPAYGYSHLDTEYVYCDVEEHSKDITIDFFRGVEEENIKNTIDVASVELVESSLRIELPHKEAKQIAFAFCQLTHGLINNLEFMAKDVRIDISKQSSEKGTIEIDASKDTKLRVPSDQLERWTHRFLIGYLDQWTPMEFESEPLEDQVSGKPVRVTFHLLSV